jgi:hypothetical protein
VYEGKCRRECIVLLDVQEWMRWLHEQLVGCFCVGVWFDRIWLIGCCACKDHGSSGCCVSRGGPPQSQRTGKASLPVPIPSATMNSSGAFDLSLSLEGTASISGSACSPPRCGAQQNYSCWDCFSGPETCHCCCYSLPWRLPSLPGLCFSLQVLSR